MSLTTTRSLGAFACPFLVRASILGAFVVGFGCTPSSTPDKSTGASQGPTESQGAGKEPTVKELGGPRDTLVLAFGADADNLLDVIGQSASDSNISSNLQYPPIDEDFDCRLQYKPGLFETWEWNETHTVLTVHLRSDIKWSDGQPVTAEDVKFVLELVADPQVASPRVAYIKNLVPGKGVEVLDPQTLRYNFTHAYDETTMLAHVGALPAHPHHALKDADRASLRGHELNRKPLVSGPWKIAKWEPDSRIVLEPNDQFTGPLDKSARLKRVIFKILPEYATRLVELENGSVDLMEAILPADADRLAAEHPEIKLYRRGWRSMDYIAWNMFDPADYKEKGKGGKTRDWSTIKPHPLFGDKAVRRALAKAIDADKLINDLLTSKTTGEKYGVRSVSTITPALCDYRMDLAPIPHNVAEAKKDLAAAGWKDADGDGILDKDGVKFSFTLATNSGNARRAKAAIIVQANLKKIGVEMQIESQETNTFFERLRKKDYDAALAGWAAGLFVDMTTMWQSGDEYEFNFVGYNNPKVDALMQKALNEPDTAKNAALWRESQRLIYEDQPYAFLYWMDEIVGLHSRFKDAKVDILSSFRDLEKWWVPASEVKYPK